MIVLLAVRDGNLLKYDTLQENLFKVKSQQAVYCFHALCLGLLPLETLKNKQQQQPPPKKKNKQKIRPRGRVKTLVWPYSPLSVCGKMCKPQINNVDTFTLIASSLLVWESTEVMPLIA